MNNHAHSIVSAKEGYNLLDILRDMKKHTSKKVLECSIENNQESRKRWMFWLFEFAGKGNSINKNYQFWQQDNRPMELSTVVMVDKRLN
jgi:putative transposase